jgi:riboflavin kinase/FMN adenylyltransferase
LLGRSFYINCEVSGGRQDGRKLGFPTLNQVPHASVAIPKHGVYVTRSIFDNGEIYYSITDVGLAPTLDKSGVVRLETHLLEANPTQAPKAFTVEFLSRIRDEQHFSTANELQEQISLDVAFARSYFNL